MISAGLQTGIGRMPSGQPLSKPSLRQPGLEISCSPFGQYAHKARSSSRIAKPQAHRVSRDILDIEFKSHQAVFHFNVGDLATGQLRVFLR
jgi:hypothetical protein